MRNITVRNKVNNNEYNYTQLKSINDINCYIDADIEFSETKEIINDIILQRNIVNRKYDGIDHLSSMHKNLNTKLCTHLPIDRKPLLLYKKEGMIKFLEKYGEIWVNKAGGYCNPLNEFEII